MKTVTLNEEEMKLATEISTLRHRKPFSRKFDSGKTDVAVGLTGVIGELAFSKLTGLDIDRRVLYGGDEGYDFLYKGKKWEVKVRDTAKYPRPDLLVESHKVECADFFVLAYWNADCPERVDFVGYCARDKVIEDNPVRLSTGHRYIVIPQRLIPMN